MEETLQSKFCPGCSLTLPLTIEFFYPNRRKDRRKPGWQSYCRDCWPTVNKRNKHRIKVKEYGKFRSNTINS